MSRITLQLYAAETRTIWVGELCVGARMFAVVRAKTDVEAAIADRWRVLPQGGRDLP
jgi:hypothetical protein